MTIFTGIVLYALLWWVVLFSILPLGIKRDEEQMEGQDKGAPANPRIVWRFITTTWVAAIVWLIVFGVIESNWISFRAMAAKMQ